MLPFIRAIVVNYNGYADTIECLTSLKAQAGANCVPLVIDNGSSDGSASQIKVTHPDIKLITLERNLGFSGGNNFAIEHALKTNCDYLFLLNNDTTMEPDCLQKLAACAQEYPDAAVVTPAIYHYADRSRAWCTGNTLDIAEGAVTMINDDLSHLTSPGALETQWANGCAMLISAEAMRKLGGFDERFFCYWEDTDWSVRAKEQGYRCLLCPSAVLYHKVSATTKKKNNHLEYYMIRNQLLFVSKHAEETVRGAYLRRQTQKVLKRTARAFISRSTGLSRRVMIAGMIGAMDFHRQRFGPCRHDWL